MDQDKIRILYTLQEFRTGGVEQRRMLVIKNLLKSEKFQFKIICTKNSGLYNDFINKNKLEIVEVGKMKHPFQLFTHIKTIKEINKFKPHIIYGGVFEGCTMAAIDGFLTRVPIRIIEETSDPVFRGKMASKLMNLYGSLSHKAVGVSPTSTTYLQNISKIPNKKIKLINNGVQNPKFITKNEIEQLKNEIGISESDFIVGTVGRLHEDHKKFSNLIKAIDSLIKEGNTNIKLLILGEGPDEDFYRKMIADLNLDKNVFILGYKKDVHKYYQLFNLFCLFSKYEAFGLVVAEAMSYSLPTLVSDVGGMKSIVKNKHTGFLIPEANYTEMAKKIKLLHDNPNLSKQMGENAFERYINNYSEDIYINNVKNLYQDLLSKNLNINTIS